MNTKVLANVGLVTVTLGIMADWVFRDVRSLASIGWCIAILAGMFFSRWSLKRLNDAQN
jgi:hypothetical protein